MKWPVATQSTRRHGQTKGRSLCDRVERYVERTRTAERGKKPQDHNEDEHVQDVLILRLLNAVRRQVLHVLAHVRLRLAPSVQRGPQPPAVAKRHVVQPLHADLVLVEARKVQRAVSAAHLSGVAAPGVWADHRDVRPELRARRQRVLKLQPAHTRHALALDHVLDLVGRRTHGGASAETPTIYTAHI